MDNKDPLPYNAPKPPIPPAWPDKEPNLSREKVDRTSTDLQLLTSKVSNLKGAVKSCLDGLEAAHDGLQHQFNEIRQLCTNLKLTIRAVERLAKGKSLGALGLPGEEEWKDLT